MLTPWMQRLHGAQVHVQIKKTYCMSPYIIINPIIRTVVRIVGMGRMSHIYNTKCSRI